MCVVVFFVTVCFIGIDETIQKRIEMNAMRDGTSTRVDGLQVYWEIKKFPDGHEYGMLFDHNYTTVIHLLHHVDCNKCKPVNQSIKQDRKEKKATPKVLKPLKIEALK